MKKMKTKNRAIPNPTAYAIRFAFNEGAAAIRASALKVHALFHPPAAAAAGTGDSLAVQLDDFRILIIDGFDDPEIFHIQQVQQRDTAFDL